MDSNNTRFRPYRGHSRLTDDVPIRVRLSALTNDYIYINQAQVDLLNSGQNFYVSVDEIQYRIVGN